MEFHNYVQRIFCLLIKKTLITKSAGKLRTHLQTVHEQFNYFEEFLRSVEIFHRALGYAHF